MRSITLLLLLTLALAVRAAQGPPPPPRLVVVDRSGVSTMVGTLPLSTYAPRVSPDGRRIAYDAEGAIWVAELADPGRTARRVAEGAYPLWSGDGRGLFYIVTLAGGRQQMFSVPAAGGTPEMIVADARAPESWSDAAQVLSYITLTGSNYDIRGYVPRDKASIAVAEMPTSEMGSRFSPDGRWLAYESFEHGMPEIYVEPWPRTGTRIRLTTGGGRRPLWSANDGEIFFDRDDQQLYVVAVQTGPAFTAAQPAPLPIKGFIQGGARRQYDLLPDGRFLMMFRP
jgi:Tol biopolymer transport system component